RHPGGIDHDAFEPVEVAEPREVLVDDSLDRDHRGLTLPRGRDADIAFAGRRLHPLGTISSPAASRGITRWHALLRVRLEPRALDARDAVPELQARRHRAGRWLPAGVHALFGAARRRGSGSRTRFR